jgi:maltooligosyltrehalose trehalohydrolase
VDERLLDPAARATFEGSKLDPSEREKNRAAIDLHKDLLALRRDDPAFSAQRADLVVGAVLGEEAFVLRFFCEKGDRLLLVNLGADLALACAPEPLLASPTREAWKINWSSDDARYGGAGIAPLEGEWGWRIPGHAAVVLG